MFENKKGQQYTLAGMAPLAIALVTAILLSGIGTRVLEDTENAMPDDSVSENVSRQGGQGLQQFAEFMPIIGLIVVAAIVLGIVRQFGG